MKTQLQNQGALRELKVMIEKQVVDDLETMAANSSYKIEELVVIALKRFRSSHLDYMKQIPRPE